LGASKRLREYVRKERKDAIDSEPLLITTLPERKKAFRKKYGRSYQNQDLDLLPKGNRLNPESLAINFRHGAERLGLSLVKGQQSPLRPKRLRKIFESACTHAGVDPNIKDIFMGHAGRQSKTYEGKSREELEFYYEMVEPKINIHIEETSEAEELREKLKEIQNKESSKISNLEEKIIELHADNKAEIKEVREVLLDEIKEYLSTGATLMEIKEDGTRRYDMHYDPKMVEKEKRMGKIWYRKKLKPKGWIKKRLKDYSYMHKD